MLRGKPYAADERASFEAWLDDERLRSPAQARKLIDIVAHVPRKRPARRPA